MIDCVTFFTIVIFTNLGILGVVLEHGGHGVFISVSIIVVVGGGRARVGVLAAAAGSAVVGLEPEVVAVREVDVRDVVNLVDGH